MENKENEISCLRKKLKRRNISTIVFVALFLVSAISVAIEYSVIQDMDLDMRFVIDMYNQKNHELNAIRGI
jgi:hypothetical protein